MNEEIIENVVADAVVDDQVVVDDVREIDSVVSDSSDCVVDSDLADEEIRTEPTDEITRFAGETQHRALEVKNADIDIENRRVRFAMSTEYPVQRSFGMEILEHSPEAIDLEFAASGRMPFLADHDHSDGIGIIEKVSLDADRVLRATVRFGKGRRASEIFDDIVDGIRPNVSVGYSISRMEKTGEKTYTAKRWSPVEFSSVLIPADPQCGLGRSYDIGEKPIIETIKPEIPTMENQIEAPRAEKRSAADVAEMYRLAEKNKMLDLAHKAAADENVSLSDFRALVLNKLSEAQPVMNADIGMTQKEVRNFSILRAVRAMANPQDKRAQEAAAFEFEVSAAAADKFGRSNGGLILPTDVLKGWNGQRDLTVAADTALYSDDFRPNEFIEALRSRSVVMQAGARILDGLVGDVKIPKGTATTVGWVTEGSALAENEATYSALTMSQKVVGAMTDYSRELINQTSMSVEAMIRSDLAASIAAEIDRAALEGSGAAGQPTGILNAGITKVATFAAANPTWAETVGLTSTIETANADISEIVYVMNSSMYGALKSVSKESGSGQFVVSPDGTIDGKRVLVTNSITDGNAYAGAFGGGMLIGQWGNGIELMLDQYTQAANRVYRILSHATVDVGVRHTGCFAYGNDTI